MYKNNRSEVFGKETYRKADLAIPESLRTIRVLPVASGIVIHTIELKGQKTSTTGYNSYDKGYWRSFSVRVGEFICGVKGNAFIDLRFLSKLDIVLCESN